MEDKLCLSYTKKLVLQSESKVTIFIRVIVYIRIAQRNKIKQKGKERKPALILLANCVWKSEIFVKLFIARAWVVNKQPLEKKNI